MSVERQIIELDDERQAKHRERGNPGAEAESEQYGSADLDHDTHPGGDDWIEPGHRILVGREKQCVVPGRGFEHAGDEERLRDPDANHQVEERPQAALAETHRSSRPAYRTREHALFECLSLEISGRRCRWFHGLLLSSGQWPRPYSRITLARQRTS